MDTCGLYIHIPFCLRKCNYCDFVSFEYNQELADMYLLALFSEIELLGERYDYPVLESVYFGGGTPTCLSGRVLGYILDKIRQCFPLKEGAEISCELNPATGLKPGLKQMYLAGINRLSIGVQSFNDKILKYLGRIHVAGEVTEVYHTAREVGFKNINLDLIFAIPGQSGEDWKHSLKVASDLKPEHLSLYNLKIEEGTPFYQNYLEGQLKPVDEEMDCWMYQEAIETLQKAGYEHYEISNFAKPGYYSRHNLRYWHYEPFLALGPGAHGFDGNIRYENTANLAKYIGYLSGKQLPWEQIIELSREDLIEEYIFMGLRLLKGISLKEFEKRFQVSLLQIYQTQVEKLVNLKLLKLEHGRISLTQRGLFLGNEVFVEFLL